MSIWFLTFLVPCHYSPYHYPMDGKILYIKWNSKKLFSIPHQLLIVLPCQIKPKKKKKSTHNWIHLINNSKIPKTFLSLSH